MFANQSRTKLEIVGIFNVAHRVPNPLPSPSVPVYRGVSAPPLL